MAMLGQLLESFNDLGANTESVIYPTKYILCEINVSAVWPYPTQASSKIAFLAVG